MEKEEFYFRKSYFCATREDNFFSQKNFYMCEKGIVYDIVEGDVFRTVVSLDEKILQKEIALRFNINANTVKYYIRKMQKNEKGDNSVETQIF